MRWTKRFLLMLALVLIVLSACASGSENGEEAPGGYTYHSVRFPMGNPEKSEPPISASGIQFFDLSIILPDGWNVLESTPVLEDGYSDVSPVDGISSVRFIYNDSGCVVGNVGYASAPPVDEGVREPMALFAGITLAKHSFDCKEAFTPVTEENTLLVATTVVVHSYSPMEEKEDFINDGILARDEDIGAYVAIEIEKDQLTDEQLTLIAKSMSLDHG